VNSKSLYVLAFKAIIRLNYYNTISREKLTPQPSNSNVVRTSPTLQQFIHMYYYFLFSLAVTTQPYIILYFKLQKFKIAANYLKIF